MQFTVAELHSQLQFMFMSKAQKRRALQISEVTYFKRPLSSPLIPCGDCCGLETCDKEMGRVLGSVSRGKFRGKRKGKFLPISNQT